MRDKVHSWNSEKVERESRPTKEVRYEVVPVFTIEFGWRVIRSSENIISKPLVERLKNIVICWIQPRATKCMRTNNRKKETNNKDSIDTLVG